MKRQVIWGLVGLLALATSALAQEASPPAQGDPGAANGQNGNRPPRQRRGPGGQGAQGGPRGMMGMNALPDSLKLTDEQKAKVAEIRQNAMQEMRQQQGGTPPSREDMQKMMENRRQLQEAAKAGDDAKVAQLQAEMDSSPFSQNRKQMQEKIDSQIAQILTTEQRRQFDQWKRLRDSGLPAQLIEKPEDLKTAALKIETLSGVQKNAIEAAYERYDRGATHADEATKATLADQFANEVVQTLKPSQKALLASPAMMLGGRGGRPGGRNGGGNAGAAPGAAPASQPNQ